MSELKLRPPKRELEKQEEKKKNGSEDPPLPCGGALLRMTTHRVEILLRCEGCYTLLQIAAFFPANGYT
jgi:hypothetical protein